MKICPVEAKLLQVDGQTDMTKLSHFLHTWERAEKG